MRDSLLRSGWILTVLVNLELGWKAINRGFYLIDSILPNSYLNKKKKKNSKNCQEKNLICWILERVKYTTCIFFGYNYYSVPFKYIGKEVDIEVGKDLLRVYYQGKERGSQAAKPP